MYIQSFCSVDQLHGRHPVLFKYSSYALCYEFDLILMRFVIEENTEADNNLLFSL